MSSTISIVERVNKPGEVHPLKLSEALERIRTANKGKYLGVFKRLRSGELSPEDEKDLKRKELPAYIFSGEFTYRNEESCKNYLGIITIDFDNLTQEGKDLRSVKEALCKDPFTLACFVSPRGNGLKALVKLPPVKENHSKHYYALERYYKDRFNLQTDEKCKDISRLCFDSFDPELFVNERSEIFKELSEPLTETTPAPSGTHSNILETVTQGAPDPKREELLNSLLNRIETVKELACKEIVRSSPLIFLNEEPYIFKNTINMIQSKEGSHKSRLVNVILSSMIRTDQSNYDFLGFNLNEEFNSPPPIILLFDTEQDQKEQVPRRLQVIKTVAGYQIEESPESLLVLPLVEFKQDEILDNIKLLTEHYRKTFPDRHLFIVIDIISDLISNINDPEKSSDLINSMNILANKNDCTLLFTIHINPIKERGAESKARGHLGTELKNKASLCIEIVRKRVKGEEEDNPLPVYQVSTRKNRKGKIHPSFKFVFDDATNLLRLATAEEVSKVVDIKTPQEFLRMLFNIFKFKTFTIKENKEITPEIKEIFGETTREQWIKTQLKRVSDLGFTSIEDYPAEIRLQLDASRGGVPNKYTLIEKDDFREGIEVWENEPNGTD